MNNILSMIGRNQLLFDGDINDNSYELKKIVEQSSFLVIGAAGSIGQAVSKEIFKRNPKKLHCVDLNENNLVELVRDIRSSMGYIDGEFKTFAIDIGSNEFEYMISANGSYDYILNLSALKHVRSEEDPFTLMRMIEVNILNTIKTIEIASESSCKKYFCVSTDKAANPVNMMGASKRIMELFLSYHSDDIDISTASFANVAFSDGSLLKGFENRLIKMQPIAAPNDVRRYFLTPQESGELCLLSCVLGKNKEIFFPKLSEELHLITFSEIAERFLDSKGFKPYICSSEEEARSEINKLVKSNQWPCFFSQSNTTGEKDFEEFYEEGDTLNLNSYKNIGIIDNFPSTEKKILEIFKSSIVEIKNNKNYNKSEIVEMFKEVLSSFNHIEKSLYLDSKM